MNWEAIGVFAEVVSAMVVVLSLIYLARELRLNRVATETASVNSLSDGWNQLNALLINDAELAQLWSQGFSDLSSLNESQFNRFYFVGQSYLNHFMTVKKHRDAGTLSEEEWLIHASATLTDISRPTAGATRRALSVFRCVPDR